MLGIAASRAAEAPTPDIDLTAFARFGTEQNVIAVRVDAEDGVLRFVTNVGDAVEAGADNAIRVEMDAKTEEPRPYLHVRRGLEALIARPVFYELAEMAEERETEAGTAMSVQSHGVWFPIGPTRKRGS